MIHQQMLIYFVKSVLNYICILKKWDLQILYAKSKNWTNKEK